MRFNDFCSLNKFLQKIGKDNWWMHITASCLIFVYMVVFSCWLNEVYGCIGTCRNFVFKNTTFLDAVSVGRFGGSWWVLVLLKTLLCFGRKWLIGALLCWKVKVWRPAWVNWVLGLWFITFGDVVMIFNMEYT
jgi:hypothetical protein